MNKPQNKKPDGKVAPAPSPAPSPVPNPTPSPSPQPAPSTAAPAETREQYIMHMKAQVSERITEELRKPENIANITAFLSKAEKDEKAIAEVNDYIGRFKTHIMNDEGRKCMGGFFYYCQCSIGSLMRAFFEAMQVHLPIDDRGLVYLTVQGSAAKPEAELEISYKGFVHRIGELYTDADWKIDLVFEGDDFEYGSESGSDWYSWKPDKARTVKDWTKVIWAFAYFTYTKGNRERAKLELMDKRELQQVRSKAKTGAVWGEWTGEMYKKAITRRACKLPFISADNNAELEKLDNKAYDLSLPALPAPPSGRVALLQNQLKAEQERRENARKTKREDVGAGTVEDSGSAVADGVGAEAGKPDRTQDGAPVSPIFADNAAQDAGQPPGAEGEAGAEEGVSVADSARSGQEVLPPASNESQPEGGKKSIWLSGTEISIPASYTLEDIAAMLQQHISSLDNQDDKIGCLTDNAKFQRACVVAGKENLFSDIEEFVERGMDFSE